MSTSDDLRSMCAAARPVIEQSLDVTDELAELRKAATGKGLDWGQVKALVKAQVQDERDNGERVKKLVEKADLACAYADMMGLAKMNKKNLIHSSSSNCDGLDIPDYLRRTPQSASAPSDGSPGDAAGHARRS